MIREPYAVYPYNVTLDAVTKGELTPGEKAERLFSFTFHGDQLRQYDYEILENNNKSNVFKPFSSLTQLPTVLYNGDSIRFPVTLDLSVQNKNLIWRLRLVENKGDWSNGNHPTMQVRNGSVEKIFADKKLFLGNVCGQWENLTTKDLQEGYLSVKICRDGAADLHFRITDYESRYYEYYTMGKGGFKLGTIEKESTFRKSYFKVQKTITKSGVREESEVTRSSIQLPPVTLKDDTGVYNVDFLFNDDEFKLFSALSVTYQRETALSENTTYVLDNFGYRADPETVYYVNSDTVSKGSHFTNRITRQSVGLSPYIYLKYKNKNNPSAEYVEKAFDNIFTAAETSITGFEISYNKLPDTIKNYQIIEKMTFEEKDLILYSVEEHLTTYGTQLFLKYLENKEPNYPKEVTRENISRDEKFPKKASILVQDANGNIFSTTTLFTKDEIDSIEDLDYGLYTILNGISDIHQNDNYYLFKNFYDSNYYYFQSRPKPEVIFADENDRPFENDGHEIDITKDTYKLNNRFCEFRVKNRDTINTKFFRWELKRNDTNEPLVKTEKTFSLDIRFSYDNFLDKYSYEITLFLTTQEDATYSYTIKNIFVEYDPHIEMETKSTAIYNPEGACIDVSWPSQKVSYCEEDEREKKYDDHWIEKGNKVARELINNDHHLTYSSIIGETLRINPNKFIISTCFAINERNHRNHPETFTVLELKSDDQNYLKLVKDDLKFKIITPKTPEGAIFKKIKITPSTASGKWNYSLFPDIPLELLTRVEHFILPESEKLKEQFRFYYLPQGRADPPNRLPERDLPTKDQLFEANTNLNKSRYSLLFGKEGAVLFRFRLNERGDWVVEETFAITNGESDNSYTLTNSYYNKVIFRGPASFKYFVLYDYNKIESVFNTESYQKITSSDYHPTWHEDPEHKTLMVDFLKGNNSAYNVDVPGVILGYRIYRYEYKNAENVIKGQLMIPLKERYIHEKEKCDEGFPMDRLAMFELQQEFVAIDRILGTLLCLDNLYMYNLNIHLIDNFILKANHEKKLVKLIFLGEKSRTELTKINYNNAFLIKDYSAHNRGYFEYQITPRIERKTKEGEVYQEVLGKAMVSEILYLDDYNWFFTSLGKRTDGTYAPLDTWKFLLNLEAGEYSHNVNKVFSVGFGKYPKVMTGTTDYISTTLTCLVGNFAYLHYKDYSCVVRLKGKTTRSTTSDKLNRVYIEKSDDLNNLDSTEDFATLLIGGKSRRIINYGSELIDQREYFFVDVHDPFPNFLPGVHYTSYEIYIMKDKKNKNNFIEIGQENIYKDTISIVNEWNQFASSDLLVLVKDIKGNCFIGAISENSESYNRSMDLLPTTVTFTITLIDNADKYQVIG